MSVMHAIDIIAGAMFDAGIGLDLRIAVISLLVTLTMGYVPIWCDSCGEMCKPSEIVTCAQCGAHVCEYCEFDETGCYCCVD